MNDESIKRLQLELLEGIGAVAVAYSGGKDSSAALKLTYQAVLRLPLGLRPTLYVIYCDTGVEIPPAVVLARSMLASIAKEGQTQGIHIRSVVAEPPLDRRFFVRVIGRGYAAPTNFFRWCTKDMRVKPVRDVLRSIPGISNIVTGMRMGESAQRDRSMSKGGGEDMFKIKHRSGKGFLLCPVVRYGTDDIWMTLRRRMSPLSLDHKALFELYRDGSDECAAIRSERDRPCGAGRFGCWTCTVVRRDKAVSNLIEAGHRNLKPLLSFRNWLQALREEPQYRCRTRRNGAPGPGPLTLAARRMILQRLKAAERSSSLKLLREDEEKRIKELWKADRLDADFDDTPYG